MILDLLLKNKLKLILFIGMFFLVSNIVSAQYYELGCCVGRINGDYCSASEEANCDTLNIGEWLSGPDYYNNNGNCVDIPSDYSGLCNKICCNVNNAGVEITRIECNDKGGVYAGLKCSSDLISLKWCLLNNKCEKMTEKQCTNAGGKVKEDQDGDKDKDDKAICEQSLSAGCIVSSDGKICRAGESNTITTGESFVDSRCSEVSSCENCWDFKWVCVDGVEHQENLCWDIIPGRACSSLEYCGKISGRCVVDNCKANNVDKNSWCEIPDPIKFPRERHKKISCSGGGERHVGYCDEFRIDICKESVDNNGKINANCVDNEWDSCFSQNEATCKDKDHEDFCLWSSNECLPKYPKGVEFWLGDKVKEASHWDNLMCSKTSEEGCKRSGDCEGGSGVTTSTGGETSGLINCGWGCCVEKTTGVPSFTNYKLSKLADCLSITGSEYSREFKSDYICTNTRQTIYPTNCPEGAELSGSGYCKCGSTICEKSGGICIVNTELNTGTTSGEVDSFIPEAIQIDCGYGCCADGESYSVIKSNECSGSWNNIVLCKGRDGDDVVKVDNYLKGCSVEFTQFGGNSYCKSGGRVCKAV